MSRRGKALYRAARLVPDGILGELERAVGRNRSVRRVIRRMTQSGRVGFYPIASGPARGMLINVAGSRPGYVLGTAERAMQAFLAEHIHVGDVVLDLGANVGYFALTAAALTGPSGRVIAYEPMPRNAEALRANIAANRLRHVDVVEAAVSDRAGRAILHLNESDQEASLVHGGIAASLSVSSVTIDDEMSRRALSPNLIKIDVEGAEEIVVRGMPATLKRARPVIVCEMHVDLPVLDGPVPSLLSDAGYELSWLEGASVRADEHYWTPHLVAVPVSRHLDAQPGSRLS
jgi:FkbM family methyltransferase